MAITEFIRVTRPLSIETKKRYAIALKQKQAIERYWRDEFRRHDVEVRLDYDGVDYVLSSNLVNGLPPKRSWER